MAKSALPAFRKMNPFAVRKMSPFDVRLLRMELKLDDLQRSNRRLKAAIGSLVLVGGALITMAQASPSTSELADAREFVLRDDSGRIRAVLGTSPDETVGLSLDDANGRTRATLAVDHNGSPGLDLIDQNGKRRAIIALSKDGDPGAGLYDSQGKLRASLDIPNVNIPGLAFYHEDGKPAWGVP
jgi:hypothetical protein